MRLQECTGTFLVILWFNFSLYPIIALFRTTLCEGCSTTITDSMSIGSLSRQLFSVLRLTYCTIRSNNTDNKERMKAFLFCERFTSSSSSSELKLKLRAQGVPGARILVLVVTVPHHIPVIHSNLYLLPSQPLSSISV